MFNTVLNTSTVKVKTCGRQMPPVNPAPSKQFEDASVRSACPVCRRATFVFLTLCVLDSVAPFKSEKPKLQTQPWFNKDTLDGNGGRLKESGKIMREGMVSY